MSILDEVLAGQSGQELPPEEAIQQEDVQTQDEPLDSLEDTQNEDETQEEVEDSNAEEQGEWQSKFEELEKKFISLDKQRRDQQSYYDKRINELQAKQESPAVEEQIDLDFDALSDELFDNPKEVLQKVFKAAQANKPAQNEPAVSRFDIQQEVMREMHEDYDEMYDLVDKAVASNPALLDEIRSSSNQAKAIYQKGQSLKESSNIQSDPQAYRAKIEAEIRAEIEAEKNNKEPRSIGDIRSTSSKKGSKRNTEKNVLDELFPR